MQDPPGAPGTARQGSTRTIVSTNSGGKATQPRAPGHERPLTASRAARHGRLSADSGAPGADVPLATTAGAPGQHCLSAALRAPGHDRPLAAPRTVDYHWSCARHHWVPGHGRFPTAPRAAGHGRLSAASPAPGADVPLASTARAPGQHRLSATSIATAPVPAGLRQLRQGCLPRVPATPNTRTYSHSRSTVSSFPHQETGVQSSFPCKRESRPTPANPVGAQHVAPVPPLCGGTIGGPGDRPSQAGNAGAAEHTAHQTIHQVHPAIQVPPRPRSCSTADDGFPLRHHPRAPPTPDEYLILPHNEIASAASPVRA